METLGRSLILPGWRLSTAILLGGVLAASCGTGTETVLSGSHPTPIDAREGAHQRRIANAHKRFATELATSPNQARDYHITFSRAVPFRLAASHAVAQGFDIAEISIWYPPRAGTNAPAISFPSLDALQIESYTTDIDAADEAVTAFIVKQLEEFLAGLAKLYAVQPNGANTDARSEEVLHWSSMLDLARGQGAQILAVRATATPRQVSDYGPSPGWIRLVELFEPSLTLLSPEQHGITPS